MICAHCGSEFTPVSGHVRYCSERCVADAKNARRRARRRNRERDTATLCGIDHGDRDINRLIAEAKTKPDCVSDARWRIELRRRADKRYYDFCPI